MITKTVTTTTDETDTEIAIFRSHTEDYWIIRAKSKHLNICMKATLHAGDIPVTVNIKDYFLKYLSAFCYKWFVKVGERYVPVCIGEDWPFFVYIPCDFLIATEDQAVHENDNLL